MSRPSFGKLVYQLVFITLNSPFVVLGVLLAALKAGLDIGESIFDDAVRKL